MSGFNAPKSNGAGSSQTSLPFDGAAAPVLYPEVIPRPSKVIDNSDVVQPFSPHYIRNFARFLAGFSAWCLLSVYYALRLVLQYLRRHPLHAALNVALSTVIAILLVTGSQLYREVILSQISDRTLDQIVSGARFGRPFDAERAAREGGREFLNVGAPHWIQRESVRAILYEARRAGLTLDDQAILLTIAEIESGFNPFARAPTTSACGLFQFVRGTGRLFGLAERDCMDPWRNARAEVEHYMVNYKRGIEKQVEALGGTERLLRSFELAYYAHHDGPAASTSSDGVRATILIGSRFLFKAQRILIAEAESQQKAPTLAQKLSTDIWRVIEDLLDRLRGR